MLGAPVAAIAAWKLWLSANHVAVPDKDYHLTDLFHPGYLGDTADRLGLSASDTARTLLDPRIWLLAVPLALVLAAVLGLRRQTRALAVLTVGLVALGYLGY